MTATRPTLAVLIIVLAAAALAPAAVPAAGRMTTPTGLESGVLDQLNGIRAQHGLAPLRLNARLSAAAAQHSREMGVDGYFRHESADGSAFWKRIARYYATDHYGLWSVGENLLWSSPDVGPTRAMEIWMHSPEHRANILSPRWREIGVAAVHVSSAPGSYNGLPVTIVTTDFGVRR
ncbi:MAG TPA: CAP domain-containing protein [Gaiellaceae bacterium]|nr:CAP domain-containing protein [Gaiellaceae bacterium]